MPAFRLTFRGKGFVDACDPTGRQVVDGFCATLVSTGGSEEVAITAGREELMKNSQVRHLIDETHAILQEEDTWTIECDDTKKIYFGWLRPKRREPIIVYHWTPPFDVDLPSVPYNVGHLNCTANYCAEVAQPTAGKPEDNKDAKQDATYNGG